MLSPLRALLMAGACLGAAGPARAPRAVTVPLRQVFQSGLDHYLPIAPSPLYLGTGRPDGIRVEPVYRGVPRYAVFNVGNGPNARHVLAVDLSPQGEMRLYVDANRNGDLTDDGESLLRRTPTSGGKVQFGLHAVTLRASYGTPTRETHSTRYQMEFYGFPGDPFLYAYRGVHRTGQVVLGGRPFVARIAEEESDGVYGWVNDPDQDLRWRRPTRLWLSPPRARDLQGPARDLSRPFQVEGQWYRATLPPDGSRITFHPLPGAPAPSAPRRTRPPLHAGTPAPPFLASRLQGGQARLSDYRGRTVVLFFWSNAGGRYCLPHLQQLEALQARIKDGRAVVLAMGTHEAPEVLRDWISVFAPAMRLELLVDPGGASPGSVASGLYHASAVPQTYVIGPDGRIADSILGMDASTLPTLEQALRRLGVRLDP